MEVPAMLPFILIIIPALAAVLDFLYGGPGWY